MMVLPNQDLCCAATSWTLTYDRRCPGGGVEEVVEDFTGTFKDAMAAAHDRIHEAGFPRSNPGVCVKLKATLNKGTK